MRYSISLMVLTCVLLLIAAFTAWGKPPRKTMADVIFEGAQIEARKGEHAVVKDVDIESIVDIDNLWAEDEEGTDLWIRFVRGILRSRQRKLPNGDRVVRWEACGEVIPREELHERATTWALSYVKSLKEIEAQTGVEINPWGAFATSANEGGFDECALCYAARRWASKHVAREWTMETWKGNTAGRWIEKKVVPRFRLTYNRDTVWKIINHKDYEDGVVKWTTKKGEKKKVRLRNKFDGGPYQIRLSVKTISRERFDYLMSIHPGIYLGMREMARRALESQRWNKWNDPHPRPWQMWPGYGNVSRSLDYDRRIIRVARWLGARRGEI